MSARAIATGTVSFGLVSIPVKLYSTSVSASAISFNLLHKKCHSRLKQQYICPTDNEIVPRDDMVKGYEFAKDRYVVFTEDELKALEEQASKAIEITEFVPIAKIDPVFYDGAYYLGPDKGGERAYRLLGEAMKQTGRCAIARYAARGKQSLVLVRPMENGLVMQQLHYADEVKSLTEVPIGDADVRPPELQLAIQFVSQLAADEFHPEKYEDSVRKRTLEQIQKKVEGEPITIAPAEAPKGQIIDLMEALKASLGQRPGGTPAAETPSGAASPVVEMERLPPKRSPRTPKAGEESATAESGNRRRK
jgi:DNA end-binding protein Ku